MKERLENIYFLNLNTFSHRSKAKSVQDFSFPIDLSSGESAIGNFYFLLAPSVIRAEQFFSDDVTKHHSPV